ncbi:hypothetical protein KJ854_05895 [Patescibacteria group bacterium]|nr:hypothetical protein [Patescibacteria group bacterium]
MKEKVGRIESFAVIGLLILAGFAMTPNVAAGYTTQYRISTGQEISFMLHGADGELAEVYYWPNQIGNRGFTAWHATPYYWYEAAAMSFYWTDNGGATWNQWRNAAVGYWPKTVQTLYSGSTNIGYKFVFKSYSAPYLAIHVKIT